MTTFEKIMLILDSRMSEPSAYGWFHILFILLVILTTYLLCKRYSKCNFDTLKKIVLISWIVMVVLEFYKQIDMAMDVEDGVLTGWSYSWYSFPFQFCSSPLYVLPLIAFSKSEEKAEPLIAFCATFSLFAGLAVYVVPGDVLITVIGVNIQTMVHHGLQIILGIFFITYKNENFTFKFFLKGLPIFVVFICCAIFLNEVGYQLLTYYEMSNKFNMFFISPHFECTMPILDILQPKVHFILFIIIYFIGFSLAAFIIFTGAKLILDKVTNYKLKKASA